jgi:hypothetical protein
MFIKQDGKMYVRDGDKIVGVNLYPHGIEKVEGTETELGSRYSTYTLYEVQCKYHLPYGGSYEFPVDVKNESEEVDAEDSEFLEPEMIAEEVEITPEVVEDEVDNSESVEPIKKHTRGRPAKRSGK